MADDADSPIIVDASRTAGLGLEGLISHPPNNYYSENKYLAGNALVCGDNLDILRELPDECVDLIYLDPPFNSNHNYVAAFGDRGTVDAQLRDIWRWTVESEVQYQKLPEGPLRNAVNAVRQSLTPKQGRRYKIA